MNTKQVAKDLHPFASYLFALTPLARKDNLTGDLSVMTRLCSKAYECEFEYQWQNICDSDHVEHALSVRSVHKLFTVPSLSLSLSLSLLWRCDPTRAMASSFLRFLDHTQRRTTFGRTPLDEWWARRRDLYLTIHNTHNRQISMPPVGFEPRSQQASGRRSTP
jgi:hypothetical protein